MPPVKKALPPPPPPPDPNPAYWDDAWEAQVDHGRVVGSGKNKTPIYAIPYIKLPKSAQNVIYSITVHGSLDDSYVYFNDRDGVTVFENRRGDLPDGGPYREYTVLMDKLESGKLRIIHDETQKIFYFTPYHYERKLQGDIPGVGKVLGPAAPPPEKENPFYMVVDIRDFKKKV